MIRHFQGFLFLTDVRGGDVLSRRIELELDDHRVSWTVENMSGDRRSVVASLPAVAVHVALLVEAIVDPAH